LEATQLKKPLAYYCLASIIGCMVGLVFLEKHYFGAAFVAASFLICIFLTIDYKRLFVVTMFFTVIAFINYISYFYRLNAIDDEITIRLKEKSQYSTIGEYKGKLISLKGDVNQFKQGDIVKVEGRFLKEPVYDKGIVGVFNVSNTQKKSSDFIGKMQEFKRSSYEKYKNVLGEKQAGMLLAACFGDVTYIQYEEKEKYNRLGILHVVSVSGLHLAIIYKLLEGLGGIMLAMPIAFIYVIFTGGEAATWRAFIMIFILKMSKRVFKNYDSISALALSAMILLFYRPYFITDIGFNLSFLSMLGIFLTYNCIRNKLMRLPKFINEAISLSLSAQFLSAPYIIAVLNNFSIGFLLGNLLLLPLFSALVIVGNISILFINLPILFNVICKILKLIFISIEGGIELILPMTPETLQLTYIYSAYISIIYCAYLLFKAGKKKYLYLPLILIPLILLENYKVVPEIDYIKLNFDNCIVFKYKTNNMLIINEKQKNIVDDKKFLKLNRIDKVFIVDEYEKTINVGEYTLTIVRSKKTGYTDLLVSNKFSAKAILYNKVERDKQVYKKYDIINLNFPRESKKYDVIASIKIFFGRFYLF
jgi:competence protein ComEC